MLIQHQNITEPKQEIENPRRYQPTIFSTQHTIMIKLLEFNGGSQNIHLCGTKESMVLHLWFPVIEKFVGCKKKSTMARASSGQHVDTLQLDQMVRE